MKTLIEILKAETASLKVQYIEMTVEWANFFYNEMKKDTRVNTTAKGGYYKRRFGATKAEDAQIDKIVSALNKGLEKYVSDAQRQAEEHYENSIMKLAERVSAKNLNIENIKAETSHIGVNIETVLSDGAKKVKAFTIIASGAVQRPHYRYLIK